MNKTAAKKVSMTLIAISPVIAIVISLFLTKDYLFFIDFVWGPHFSYQWTSPSLLMEALANGLSVLVPSAIVEKLYITACFGLLLWGTRKLAGVFLKDFWLIFIVSLFAVYNPFIYDRAMYGQFSIIAACGLMFLGAGFLLEYLRLRKMREIIFAGFSFAFAIQCSQHFLFFIPAFYLFVFAPGFFSSQHKRLDGINKKIKTFVIISAIIFGIAFLVNANWIVGAATGSSGLGNFISTGITQQDLVAFQTVGKTGSDALFNVLTLSGFWASNQFANYVDWSFLLLFPLMIWGFISGIRSKEKEFRYMTIGSAALFIVSIALAAGIRIPVGRELTYFLFNHLPFYKGLRETQKWDSVTAMIYLIFLSLGLRELFSKKISESRAVMIKIFIAVIILVQAPILIFGLVKRAHAAEYPSDWYTVDQYLVEQGCPKPIYLFPWYAYLKLPWVNGVVANPAPTFFQCLVGDGNAVILQGNIHEGTYIIVVKESDDDILFGKNSRIKAKLVVGTPTLNLYQSL